MQPGLFHILFISTTLFFLGVYGFFTRRNLITMLMSLELILKIFPIVVTSSEADAVSRMACNAAVWRSKTAIIQKGATAAAGHMRAMGLDVIEVDTSEFVKSGGSVYCMKQYLFG